MEVYLKNIEKYLFLRQCNEYIDKLWALFNATGKLELVGGKVLDKEQIQNPTPNKILKLCDSVRRNTQ
jgi:hypothetical protein